ncbi:hypothetical protein EVAR_23988_1 [Eumeta japonica]|uniref:Uncharacterized protein n=1 Tax=Eumeta variegata TaxID=151549 RepID=A0A4C1V2L3_EUMVA|nr:hypothetical protein EVAR_23988_1 [Eumeta japonica]
MVIDGHDVVAEYVEPKDSAESFIPDLPSPQWYSEHVRESQYLLQPAEGSSATCGKDMPVVWIVLLYKEKKFKEHVNSYYKQPNPSNNRPEIYNIRPSRILTRRSIGRSREILCVVSESDDAE